MHHPLFCQGSPVLACFSSECAYPWPVLSCQHYPTLPQLKQNINIHYLLTVLLFINQFNCIKDHKLLQDLLWNQSWQFLEISPRKQMFDQWTLSRADCLHLKAILLHCGITRQQTCKGQCHCSGDAGDQEGPPRGRGEIRWYLRRCYTSYQCIHNIQEQYCSPTKIERWNSVSRLCILFPKEPDYSVFPMVKYEDKKFVVLTFLNEEFRKKSSDFTPFIRHSLGYSSHKSHCSTTIYEINLIFCQALTKGYKTK